MSTFTHDFSYSIRPFVDAIVNKDDKTNLFDSVTRSLYSDIDKHVTNKFSRWFDILNGNVKVNNLQYIVEHLLDKCLRNAIHGILRDPQFEDTPNEYIVLKSLFYDGTVTVHISYNPDRSNLVYVTLELDLPKIPVVFKEKEEYNSVFIDRSSFKVIDLEGKTYAVNNPDWVNREKLNDLFIYSQDSVIYRIKYSYMEEIRECTLDIYIPEFKPFIIDELAR